MLKTSDFEYEIVKEASGSFALIQKWTRDRIEIKVPNVIDNLPVYRIQEDCFQGLKKVKTITMADSLFSDHVMDFSNLESLEMVDLKQVNGVFSNCFHLKEIRSERELEFGPYFLLHCFRLEKANCLSLSLENAFGDSDLFDYPLLHRQLKKARFKDSKRSKLTEIVALRIPDLRPTLTLHYDPSFQTQDIRDFLFVKTLNKALLDTGMFIPTGGTLLYSPNEKWPAALPAIDYIKAIAAKMGNPDFQAAKFSCNSIDRLEVFSFFLDDSGELEYTRKSYPNFKTFQAESQN